MQGLHYILQIILLQVLKHMLKCIYRIFRAITRALSVDFFVFKAAARYRPVRVM